MSGCGENDQYPSNLTYSVRNDFFVRDIPKTQPTAFETPGQMPLDFLATLPRRFDPDSKMRVIDIAKVEDQIKAGTLKLNSIQNGVLEEYKANNVVDPRNLTAAERNKMGEMLTKLFGTPAAPIVKVKGGDDEMGVTQELSDRLKLDAKTLQEGSALYRRHCLHCHGLEGNGRGPTGYWVNPHPRDYRKGVFKFTSSTQDLGERKPRREDLMHVIVHGLEGTSMPSFNMYPREDLEKIVSYVMHLSMRGEIEIYVIDKWFQEGKLVAPPTSEEIQQVRAAMAAQNKPADEIEKTIKDLMDIKAPNAEQEKSALAAMEPMFNEAVEGFSPRWLAAQDAAIIPDPYPYEDTEEALLASAARGAQLFNAGTASCVSCHKNLGREAPYYFDAWGTVVRPRNLAEGYMRGGKRPIDIYYRVWSGIAGSGMANYDKELRPSEDDKAGKIDRMWDLVNYTQALHYPDLRAKLKARGVQID
jgi:mono/diheme cytochrome c family protein